MAEYTDPFILPPAGRASLGKGEVHLWRASLQLEDLVIQRLKETLSPDEAQRAARFRFPKDQNRFVAGRGVLRDILGRYTGIPASSIVFGYGSAGKPYLAGNDGGRAVVEFNLAHSHGLALYGVTLEGQIGVDLEKIRPGVECEKLARRFFAPEEVAALEQCPPEERVAAFFRGWTRKEAFLKALGKGLRAGLASCVVSLEAGEQDALLRVSEDLEGAGRWRLSDVAVDGQYSAAYAVSAVIGIGPPRYYRWDDLGVS